jgi:hypothetical protein
MRHPWRVHPCCAAHAWTLHGTEGGRDVQFEVPAGNALIFSRPDGELLDVPEARPMTRPVAIV